MKKLSLLLVLLITAGFVSAASGATTPPLVGADWLAKHKDQNRLVILDVQEAALFSQHHLPGSVNIPFSQWRTQSKSAVPGALRPIEDYEKMLGERGISNDHHIVITATGLQPADLSAPARVFWTLRLLGHQKISLLDGGLADYAKQRLGPIMRGKPKPRDPVEYKALPDMTLLAHADDLANAELSIDARSPEEYLGLRSGGPDERSGTVPGAINLPYSWLTEQSSSGSLREEADIRALFRRAGIEDRDGAVHFCHTGHRAALTWFIDYAVLGNREARLYDASMVEWARDPDREIEVKWEL